MKKIWKIFVGVIFLAVCSGCGIKKEQKKTIEDTKEKIYRECEMLAEGYRNIYENAVKENALYELSTIQKSIEKSRKREEWKNYYISSYSRGSFYPV